MAKISLGPGLGFLIAKLIGLFRGGDNGSGSCFGSKMPPANKLQVQVAGSIPPPMQTSLERDRDDKYKGEDATVPLTGKPPSSNKMQGFLYKPIGSALGTISLYMPIEARVREVALMNKNGVVLWTEKSAGSPGDDGRPFWRTDVYRDAMASGGWVRAVLANGQYLWYPIASGMVRNGSGHGNAPPHLYPFC